MWTFNEACETTTLRFTVVYVSNVQHIKQHITSTGNNFKLKA